MQPTHHPAVRTRRQPQQNRTDPAAPQAKGDDATRQAGTERPQEALGGRRVHSRLSWPTACIGLLGLAVSYLAVRMAATPQQLPLMADPSPLDTASDHPQASSRRVGAETDLAWTSEPASRSLAEREASTVTPTQADRGSRNGRAGYASWRSGQRLARQHVGIPAASDGGGHQPGADRPRRITLR